jgi:hypothetical protein
LATILADRLRSTSDAYFGSQPLPLEAAAAQTCHLGRRSGLVDKHQAMRFKPHSWLSLIDPSIAGFLDIWPVLLACQQGFF